MSRFRIGFRSPFIGMAYGLLVSIVPAMQAQPVEMIFTVDSTQSFVSLDGSLSTGFPDSPLTEQQPGSLQSSSVGNLRILFDPANPTTIRFLGGDGFVRFGNSIDDAVPGGGPAVVAGQATVSASDPANGTVSIAGAFRDVTFDFLSLGGRATDIRPGGFFAQDIIDAVGRSGRFESSLAFSPVGTPPDFSQGVRYDYSLDDESLFLSNESSKLGQLTEVSPGHWQVDFDFELREFIQLGPLYVDFTANVKTVATATISVLDGIISVGEEDISASALGGSSVPGGVTINFDESAGAGMFTVQQIPVGGLPFNAVQASTTNDQLLASLGRLGPLVQAWNVEYYGELGDVATLVFGYDESLLPEGLDESALGIWHFDESLDEFGMPIGWTFGGVTDVDANTITFTTSHLSPFVIGVPEVSSATMLMFAAIIAGGCWLGRFRSMARS